MGLAHYPVGISGQSPASDGADQSLGVRERRDEERDKLRKMRQHASHTPLGHCSQSQDGSLLHQPILSMAAAKYGR